MAETHRFGQECAVTYHGAHPSDPTQRKVIVQLGDKSLKLTCRYDEAGRQATELEIGVYRADDTMEWVSIGGAKFR